ncbi:MAG: ATP-binding protein [bacterium]|nr:ATP-binding protein [bacterium]
MPANARQERADRIRLERLAQLGTLLAGFAHEVRNPLSTIGLNLQLVLEEYAAAESARDKRTHKRLSTVHAEVQRLQTILEEFLSFARAPEPKLVPVTLNDGLQEVVEFHQPEMAEAEVSLRFYPDSAVREIAADWNFLRAAIVNLLRNARDATPAGGEILLSTKRVAGSDGRPDHVLVRVTDTGAGIAPELQERVFEPYVSTKKAGTGLGLATVRRVVAEHGGTLSMESEIGKGTQFTMTLPLQDA